MRTMPIYTPDQYKMMLQKFFEEANLDLPFEIIDLYVVPDYKAYLDPYLTGLARTHKGDQTNHQWIFTAVPISDKYPLGVKTEYRKYSADEVYEIRKASEIEFAHGYQPSVKLTPVKFPVENVECVNVLRMLPYGIPQPAEFKKGFRDQFQKTIASVKKDFTDDIVREWVKFSRETYPISEDVREYVKKKPLYIPLRERLFGFFLPLVVPSTREQLEEGFRESLISNTLEGVFVPCVIRKGEKGPCVTRRFLHDERLASTELVKRLRDSEQQEGTRKKKVKASKPKLVKVNCTTKTQLKQLLKEKGLTTGGNVPELQARCRENGIPFVSRL